MVKQYTSITVDQVFMKAAAGRHNSKTTMISTSKRLHECKMTVLPFNGSMSAQLHFLHRKIRTKSADFHTMHNWFHKRIGHNHAESPNNDSIS